MLSIKNTWALIYVMSRFAMYISTKCYLLQFNLSIILCSMLVIFLLVGGVILYGEFY
jgi:hypothetical protein